MCVLRVLRKEKSSPLTKNLSNHMGLRIELPILAFLFSIKAEAIFLVCLVKKLHFFYSLMKCVTVCGLLIGVCNLCNGGVRFVRANDRKRFVVPSLNCVAVTKFGMRQVHKFW